MNKENKPEASHKAESKTQTLNLALIPCEATAVLRLVQRYREQNGDGIIEMEGATPSTFANIAAKIEGATAEASHKAESKTQK